MNRSSRRSTDVSYVRGHRWLRKLLNCPVRNNETMAAAPTPLVFPVCTRLYRMYSMAMTYAPIRTIDSDRANVIRQKVVFRARITRS